MHELFELSKNRVLLHETQFVAKAPLQESQVISQSKHYRLLI